MKSWFLLCLLLSVLTYQAAAKRGSISSDLFQDDENDDVPEPEEDAAMTEEDLQEVLRMNPCHKKKCYRGEMCRINEERTAECVCVDYCEKYRQTEDRHKVCSSKNDTYLSECDLDRDHCLCKHGREGCTRPGAKKIHLEYYGVCKESPKCTENQMEQFPKRMRDWFYVIMEVLERRADLKEYVELMEEAKTDTNHSSAAIWKFCDLDRDPQDRFVSRRELQHTVRTLRALEHCLVPFLDQCDVDDNREIALTEWAMCLGIDHEHVSNRCVEIHEQRKKDKKRK